MTRFLVEYDKEDGHYVRIFDVIGVDAPGHPYVVRAAQCTAGADAEITLIKRNDGRPLVDTPKEEENGRATSSAQ